MVSLILLLLAQLQHHLGQSPNLAQHAFIPGFGQAQSLQQAEIDISLHPFEIAFPQSDLGLEVGLVLLELIEARLVSLLKVLQTDEFLSDG